MAEPYVKHADVAAFADEKVNLHRDDVKKYREQVHRLRDRLAEHINEHPDFALVKMLHSGSVAKGTALRTINDMDVAVYVSAGEVPSEETLLLSWLADRLREAYPNLASDQIRIKTHCVTISFRGTGLDVDVVPVLYEGDPEDKGYLIEKETGDRVLTSIPLHLEFIRTRKDAQPTHFAQLVRLVKWWERLQKVQRSNFRFKSFMVELILAHLLGKGVDFSNYPLALEQFFAYIVKTELKEQVYFTDYYLDSAVPNRSSAPIEIIDPVNPANNVAMRYSDEQRLAIIEAAHDALDAINEAHYATTKTRAVARWRDVLGPSFSVA